ncbi:MAG: transcription elongation factor GreA [Candidatus Doudnabacteria bacterium]|nr:transcription elongation factor GreA [bacterium]MDZ4243517.1 transcription elongation factor GreA [Candidatus Doudnabacteria bacterium]
MDMPKRHLLTQEGLDKLKKELEGLVNQKRKEVIERIQEAVAHGDLSENADYAQAKEEQAFIEGRIQELEETIKNAELIKTSGNRNIVSIGSTVRCKANGEERVYTIVGANEANPAEGRISNESLVGQKLLGSKIGDAIEIETPAGKVQYQVVEIL